jgi:hypothetical protein
MKNQNPNLPRARWLLSFSAPIPVILEDIFCFGGGEWNGWLQTKSYEGKSVNPARTARDKTETEGDTPRLCSLHDGMYPLWPSMDSAKAGASQMSSLRSKIEKAAAVTMKEISSSNPEEKVEDSFGS